MRNEYVNKKLKVAFIENKMRENKLRWLGGAADTNNSAVGSDSIIIGVTICRVNLNEQGL